MSRGRAAAQLLLSLDCDKLVLILTLYAQEKGPLLVLSLHPGPRHICRSAHRLVVGRDDHVSLLEACASSRTVRIDPLDQDARHAGIKSELTPGGFRDRAERQSEALATIRIVRSRQAGGLLVAPLADRNGQLL